MGTSYAWVLGSTQMGGGGAGGGGGGGGAGCWVPAREEAGIAAVHDSYAL